MKIAVVSHSAVVNLYREKFQALVLLGCEIHLILPPGWPEGGRWIAAPSAQKEKGVFIHVLPAWGLGRVGGFCLRGLEKLLRSLGPDMVHAEEEPYAIACWQVFRAARRLQIPAIFFTWENILRHYKWPLNWIDRQIRRTARWAIAGNQAAEQVLRQRGFPGQCFVIPQYGINPQWYVSRSMRKKPDQPFRIGYVGRLLEEKGIHTLIKAVAQLTFPWRLLIMGHGPYEKEIKQIIKKHQLTDRVRLRPAVPHDQVAASLRQLELLVLPSETRPQWKEQFGRILIEAMACEIPVIGSDSGEIPRVIAKAGLIFPEGQDRVLAEKIHWVFKHCRAAKILAHRGRERVLKYFTNEAIARQTLVVYHKLLKTTEGH